MMEFLANNWEMILIILLAIVGLTSFLSKKENIQNLLVYVCLEAEKQYGSKTGTIKLRQVYDWFTSKYPIMSAIITFNQFSKMVDIALEEMRHLIETNKNLFDYVSGI